MPNSSNSRTTRGGIASVHALGHPSSAPPQTRWGRPGPAKGSEPAMPAVVPAIAPAAAQASAGALPNAPAAPVLTLGTGTTLTATWAAPARSRGRARGA